MSWHYIKTAHGTFLKANADGSLAQVDSPNRGKGTKFELVSTEAPVEPSQPPPPSPPPSTLTLGPVTLDGPHLVYGGQKRAELVISGFWLPLAMKKGGELRDNAHTLCRFARDHGITSVRVWGVKRYRSGAYTSPNDPNHWTHLSDTLDLLEGYGLRALWTLWAGGSENIDFDRDAYLEEAAEKCRLTPENLVTVEVINEHYTKGADVYQVRQWGQVLAQGNPVPVALSAPNMSGTGPGDTKEDRVEALYTAASPTIMTQHFDRRHDTGERSWRHTRQPYLMTRVRGCPPAWLNSEPVGPGSSGYSEESSARIVAAYLNTLVCGGTGYCLHGGWWDGQWPVTDYPNIGTIASELQRARELVEPLGLPGRGVVTAAHLPNHPIKDAHAKQQAGEFNRAFGRVDGNKAWVVVTDSKGLEATMHSHWVEQTERFSHGPDEVRLLWLER